MNVDQESRRRAIAHPVQLALFLFLALFSWSSVAAAGPTPLTLESCELEEEEEETERGVASHQLPPGLSEGNAAPPDHGHPPSDAAVHLPSRDEPATPETVASSSPHARPSWPHPARHWGSASPRGPPAI